MPRHIGWARCLDNEADILRRGAWYPVLEETSDGKVVIEVRQKPVRLSRVDVRNVPAATCSASVPATHASRYRVTVTPRLVPMTMPMSS
jgi:hypothetical protein